MLVGTKNSMLVSGRTPGPAVSPGAGMSGKRSKEVLRAGRADKGVAR